MSEEFTYEGYIKFLRDQSQRTALSGLNSGILHSHGQAQQVVSLQEKLESANHDYEELMKERTDYVAENTKLRLENEQLITDNYRLKQALKDTDGD
jgi:cell division protein FtsB